MSDKIERNLGDQPIADIMAGLNLNPHDLAKASSQQLTHKMVTRACKGRRLTTNSKSKVLTALNLATGKSYTLSDIFNYYLRPPQLSRIKLHQRSQPKHSGEASPKTDLVKNIPSFLRVFHALRV